MTLEASPAYLERVIEAFLDAMREAESLTHAGKVDELPDLLRFAADLCDIIDESLRASDRTDAPIAEVGLLRTMLRGAQARIKPRSTLH
jgi:hypothetical protein